MTIDQLLAELEILLAARKERKMSDYKLVPVEPTAEMERAAEIYWNERRFEWLSGDPRTWAGVYQAMLAAAPAVKGEPVVWMYSYIGGTAVQTSKERWTGRDWKSYWEETPLYTTPQPAPNAPAFQLGDHVRKTKGSQWKGRVVGTSSTSLTPEGYAVESDTEKGSVQIYPVGALELVGEKAESDVAGLVEALEAAQKESVRGINHARSGAQAAAALGRVSAICGAALAAHRKGGDTQ